MITKHFFKILFLFIVMILLSLVGIFSINNLNQNKIEATEINTKTQVAN